MQIKQLQESRGALVREADGLIRAATRERRDLTDSANRRVEDIKSEIFQLDIKLAAEQRQLESHFNSSHSAAERRDMDKFSIARAVSLLADGKALDGVEAEMNFEGRAHAANTGIKAQGNLILPLHLLTERRDMTATLQTTAAGDQGGNFVQTSVGDTVPLLYSKSVLRSLGATYVNGLIGNVSIPQLKSGAIATHKTETGALDESSPTTGSVELAPNRLGTYVEISRQLLHQSNGLAERLVQQDLMTTLALGIENGALNGTGANNQPLGLLHDDSGIGFDSVVGGDNGALPTWDTVLLLEEAIASANADQAGTVGYLTNPKVRRVLRGTLKAATHHEFAWNGSALNGYKAEVSTLVPSDLDKGSATEICSAIIFGNWSDLMIGVWGGIDIMVNPYIKDIEGLVRITGSVFYDTAIRRPESFVAMRDALTA